MTMVLSGKILTDLLLLSEVKIVKAEIIVAEIIAACHNWNFT